MTSTATDAGLDGHRPVNVKELLRHYDRMSIPHFQRGLVWDTGSVASLLESIYLGTPCGSIILWAPSDVAVQGTPLGPGEPLYLIIDGQQRIRTLHAVFADNDDESVTISSDGSDEDDEKDANAPDEEADDEEGGVWCLNLGRLPGFSGFTGGKRFRLFRRARDPRSQRLERNDHELSGAPLQDREALLPLKWFLESLDDEAAMRAHIAQGPGGSIAKAVQAVLENETVTNRVRQMLTRPVFHVSILPTDDDLADVVGVFNRINSAGKRVEAEEKAFANLVAEYKDANSSLERFFVEVHGDDSKAGRKAFFRDNLLRRQKENRFGFKLFMRTFVIALAYHSDRKIGSASFSFESANAETLAKAGSHLRTMLDTTVTVLEHVAAILRDTPLFCDDLRMLPETASLWPLFQLLIAFPRLMPDSKDVLASVALRLMLADLSKRELLELCEQLNHTQSAKQALDLFEGHEGLSSERIQDAILKGVGAQSLTNRYTLLLYWLLRSQHARDFSYAENAHATAAYLRQKYETDDEPELSERLEPQKQHIVPYAHLKNLFDLAGARPGRHEAHDIGNLTYISAGLNSFKTGVGKDPLKLSAEPHQNQDAHILMDPGLLAEYQIAISSDFKSAKASYRRFCARRRDLIVERLLKWEQEEHTKGRLLPEDLVSLPRLIRPRPQDIMRSLSYPDTVRSCLVDLCNRSGVGLGRLKDDRLSIVCRRKKAGGNNRQVLRVDLHKNGNNIRVKFGDDGLLTGFSDRFPDIRLDRGKTNDGKRARASFVDSKHNRLFVDRRNNSDGTYTVKVIHKVVLPDGGIAKRAGMISDFNTAAEAEAKFDEYVKMALAENWTPMAKGKARKFEVNREVEMVAVLQWIAGQLPSAEDGT